MRALWAFAILALAGVAQAADLPGTWAGTWTKNGDALPVSVTFRASDSGFSGSFDSDALQVAGIPFREVRADPTGVHFVLAGDESTTTFDGTLHGDVLDGSFAESSTRGTFQLVRSAAVVPAIQTRDVTYVSGGATIAGTLLLPAAPGRHPGVVFLHGSGPEGRWANRWLAQRFAQAGFAALITDKRGVGQSTGNWQDEGFDELADDAAAGIRFLAAQREIDPRMIGLYGHSQGGTIAPLVFAKAPETAFIIASAPGGIDPGELEEYSVGNAIGVAKLPPAEAADARTFVHAIVNVAYRGKPRSELDEVSARFKGRDWYFDPPPADNYYWTFARRIAGYDPASAWRQVKAPVLVLAGGRDERIPTTRSDNTILAALRSGGNKRVTLKVYPDADHTFTLPTTGGWPKHVPNYADMIIRWVKKQV